MKELKDAIDQERTDSNGKAWNPVKELKVAVVVGGEVGIDGDVWNPVKELKVLWDMKIEARKAVESGEGIESRAVYSAPSKASGRSGIR